MFTSIAETPNLAIVKVVFANAKEYSIFDNRTNVCLDRRQPCRYG